MNGKKKVNSDTFPLLWVDIPDVLVLPKFPFKVEDEPVKILYIGAEGLADLELPKREALYSELRRAAASCYHFDAFISYNSLDELTARRWADALSQKGLQIYIDTPTTGTEFPSRLAAALLGSRAIIALVSPNVMVRDTEDTGFYAKRVFTKSILITLVSSQCASLAGGMSSSSLDSPRLMLVKMRTRPSSEPLMNLSACEKEKNSSLLEEGRWAHALLTAGRASRCWSARARSSAAYPSAITGWRL